MALHSTGRSWRHHCNPRMPRMDHLLSSTPRPALVPTPRRRRSRNERVKCAVLRGCDSGSGSYTPRSSRSLRPQTQPSSTNKMRRSGPSRSAHGSRPSRASPTSRRQTSRGRCTHTRRRTCLGRRSARKSPVPCPHTSRRR
eukprot:4593872-Prymnesium_polylepis.1